MPVLSRKYCQEIILFFSIKGLLYIYVKFDVEICFTRS
jgi:hypothetical protein